MHTEDYSLVTIENSRLALSRMTASLALLVKGETSKCIHAIPVCRGALLSWVTMQLTSTSSQVRFTRREQWHDHQAQWLTPRILSNAPIGSDSAAYLIDCVSCQHVPLTSTTRWFAVQPLRTA